jgi:hypothetical protein
MRARAAFALLGLVVLACSQVREPAAARAGVAGDPVLPPAMRERAVFAAG